MKANRQARQVAASLLSLGLPIAPCEATTAPQEGLAEFRLMHYQETQEGTRRMQIKAQSSRFILPVSDQISAELSQVVDAVSGASPLYYTDPAVFANVRDLRQARDLKLSIHGEREKLSLGANLSEERDYHSRTQSLAYNWRSPSQLISIDLAHAQSKDLINPVNQLVRDEKKTWRDYLIAATVVLSPRDLLQVQRTSGSGSGYFSDPYKLLDRRPDDRNIQAWVIRWHHYHPALQTSSRLSLRRLNDSFGIRSDTLQWELAKRLGESDTLTPGLRLYSQRAAYFFSPPNPERPELPNLPSDFQLGRSFLSFDQRLSQFGAINLSLKWEHAFGKSVVDLRMDYYLQKNKWSWHGPGSPGLADFSAMTWQLGWRRPFDRLSF